MKNERRGEIDDEENLIFRILEIFERSKTKARRRIDAKLTWEEGRRGV